MSKILSATCDVSGKVFVGDFLVPDAEVLSEGKQESTGLLFLDQYRKQYLPSSATDIKTTIEKLNLALTQIASTLTSIGAGMTGPTTSPPPTLATDVANINSIKAELEMLKGALK